MPVRIVLRGLILVSVNQDEDHPERGSITARLIDGSRSLHDAVQASIEKYKGRTAPHPDFEKCMLMHQGHHTHQGEIQIFDGDKAKDGAGLDPLDRGDNVDIQIDPANENFVETEMSYDKFMPKLRKIANKFGLAPTPRVNPDFISNTVTINRGVVRVREVGDWDAGSITIPDRFRLPQDSEAVYQPAKVRFLNANVYGYVATECVIEVMDANSVTIGQGCRLKGTYTGHPEASRRAAEDTVEILITNYAPQQTIPLPWTLHYRWMFEAAGYGRPINLGGNELHELAAFGEEYDSETWICEREMFLGPDGETGYPFPYRTPDMWRVRLGDLDYANRPETPEAPELVIADPWDPVRCPMGDLGKS